MLLVRSSVRLLALLLGLAAALLVASPAHAAPPSLTRSQEGVVLRLVDDACADTWCSGDVDLQFRRLRCTHGGCTLGFAVALRTDAPRQWQPRRGEVRGLFTFSQLVSTSPNGYRSLTPDFFDAVGEVVRAAAPPRG